MILLQNMLLWNKITSYSLGDIRVVFALLQLDGGDGVMMDINTVTEKRDT